MYAIIDIETSGGSPQRDKITEIAVYIFDGNLITDTFVTLVNPEVVIPDFITSLTGITNDMVADAPKFYQIARQLVEITDNKVFVAHNAAFDYNFIKTEFQRLGYDYKRQVLCTVKLSRKLIPGHTSYSLGNLCNDLQIQIENRHRAAGDALATVELFRRLLDKDGKQKPLIEQMSMLGNDGLHPNLDRTKIEKLPSATGVYYFYNERNDLIYIGKSNNIHTRVQTHLRNNQQRKAIEMKSQIADVSYELTGSELVALLMESDEIKQHQPLFNRAQRRAAFGFGIMAEYNNDGYLCFSVGKTTAKSNPITAFTSLAEAKNRLSAWVEEFTLCQKLAGLYHSQGACFHHGIDQCKGACIGKELPHEYNVRAEALVHRCEHLYNNVFIIDRGRHNNERSVVKIANGSYHGFGFIDLTQMSLDNDNLNDCIRRRNDNRDIRQIIRHYLLHNKVERIVQF